MKQNRYKKVAFEAIAKASDTLGEGYFLNAEKCEKVEKACDLLEEIEDDPSGGVSCKSLFIYSDLPHQELIFEFVCDRDILWNGPAKLFRVIRLVDFARFSTVGGNDLRIECFISKLWCTPK